jgi:hypothetical protein
MRRTKTLPTVLLLLSAPILLAALSLPSHASGASSAVAPYLITNDDNGIGGDNTATFFPVAANGALGTPALLDIGGTGAAGGYFAANRVNVLSNATSPCAYLSSGISNTIAGVQILTQTVTGNFSASSTDNGADNGIGMVMNSNYLYATFSSSGTVATFAVEPECALQFLADISPVGLNGGTVKGMGISGNLLIVTYGDGSIQSFNISRGVPIPNADEQNAAGYASDDYPDGVDITQDGHYVIFGDASSAGVVEVSDISAGTLAPTVLYHVGQSITSGFNSNNVRLSPDETLLYIGNNSSGQVSAAFFNSATGVVTPGCASAQLKGFDSSFGYLSSPVTLESAGTGSLLYVAEFGQPSAIAVLKVRVMGGACSLTELAESPVADPNSLSLLSIGVYPPRPF